jgi:hypothetical protein
MQGSLPAGWLAFTGRELNPLDRDEGFQITSSSLPGLFLAQRPIPSKSIRIGQYTLAAITRHFRNWTRNVVCRDAAILLVLGVNRKWRCTLEMTGCPLSDITGAILPCCTTERLIKRRAGVWSSKSENPVRRRAAILYRSHVFDGRYPSKHRRSAFVETL